MTPFSIFFSTHNGDRDLFVRPLKRTRPRRFGEVLDADVRRDPQSGRSKGFGFVTFATEFRGSKHLAAVNGQVTAC